MHFYMRLFVIFLACTVGLFGQDLASVRKIFIAPMEASLDQYIRAEFVKRAKERFEVVLDKSQADGILTGILQTKDGAIHTITGRYFGLEDNATAAISLVDRTEKKLLWAGEAGDRTLIFSIAHRNGERKVA